MQVFDKFKNVEEQIKESKSNSLNQSARLVYLSQFNFSIDTDQILLIEKEGYKSYTFPIYRDNEVDKTENLVITESNGLVNAYISKYNLNENDKANLENNQFVDLNNKTEFLSLEARSGGEPCFVMITEPLEWNEQGQVTISFVYAVEVDCPDDDGPSGSGPSDGGSDGGNPGFGWPSNPGLGGPWGNPYNPGGTFPGGGTPGNGNPSNPGSENPGGNDGNPSNDGTNPEEANPILTDGSGNPIITSPVLIKDRHKNALNKLTTNNSDGTKTKVKEKIDDLKVRLTTDFKEMGYHFIKDGNDFIIREPIWRGPNQVAYSNGDQIAQNTKVVLHMHQNLAEVTKGINLQTGLPNITYKELVPIWSNDDIYKTADQFGELDNDSDLTSILVTQEGTFALRVDDSDNFNDTNLTLGYDAAAKDKFDTNFMKNVLEPCNGGSDSCYVEKFIMFLNTYQINDHPIGLVMYQAVFDNQGNIINWIKK